MIRSAWKPVALTAVSLFLFSITLSAQAPPSADTFVSSAYPTTNFGSVNSLTVGPGSTSYVQFNLATIPAGVTVSKATLRLYVDLVVKPGKFDVYQVNKSWSEGTLTYNTQPLPLGGSLTGGAGISITTASWNQFLLIDITSLVQTWVNSPDSNKGVALTLTSSSTGNFYFDAKESLLTGNGPELEISLAGTAGPQGPQGAQGPQGITGTQGPKGDTGATGPQGLLGPKGDTGAAGAQGLQGSQGPQGQMGPQGGTGPQGPIGVDGAAGPQGPQGAAGQGFNFRSAFNNSAEYASNDVASYNGSSYVAKTATTSGDPAPDVNPNWSLMAQQGAPGPAGSTGSTGPQGLIGPMGPIGLQGPQGPMPQGAALTTISNTFAASQTINGSLTLAGTGAGVHFADGTIQTSASGSDSTCNSSQIFSTSAVTPPGYSPIAATPAGNLWLSAVPMPTARNGPAAVALNGKIYTIGGSNLASVDVYDPATNTWTAAAPMNAARQFLAAVSLNGFIYAIGGLGQAGGQTSMERYDPAANTWTSVASMSTPRSRLGAVSFNGSIYVFGGLDATNAYLFSVERYSPELDSWSTFFTALPTPRARMAAVTLNNLIYLIGGRGSGPFVTTMDVYDPVANVWTTATPKATPSILTAAVTLNGKIYAMAGFDAAGQTLNTMEMYDPGVNLWTTEASVPTARFGLAADTVNGLIYAFGGLANSIAVTTNEQYSPPLTVYTFVKN